MSNSNLKKDGDLEGRNSASLFRRAVGFSPFAKARQGSASFTNLSIYAFGLSGVWTGVGSGILPFKILEVLESQDVQIAGYALDKNGALGMISLLGLIVAALVQLGAGALSDRDDRLGRRIPFLVVGGAGLALLALLLGLTTTFVGLLLIIIAMQLFGNFAQGPANALIVDHVEPTSRGEAAGVLNLWRLLGAGSVTVVVLQFMSRYDAKESPQWLWYSLALMVAVLVISIVWTAITIRPKTGFFIPSLTRKFHAEGEPGLRQKVKKIRLPITRSYLAFLVALAFTIAAMSSMQIYALFFLQDVVGLDNPADGADILVVVIVAFAGITVLPAGLLADRVGRSNLFVIAGVLGVLASTLLLFASSIGPVLAIGTVIGISVGLFMTLTWTVANDLVRKSSAAQDLGYTSIATLVGAAAARFAGIGIDELNDISENLGYKAILIFVAIAFALAASILARVARDPSYGRSLVTLEPSTASGGSE